jgi:phosphonate ABC transporter substrate-binding protein
LVVRTPVPKFAFVIAAVAAAIGSPPRPAQADVEGIEILVLKEHGVGSATLVQPYLDRFIASAAEENDWADAKGQYYNNRAAAEAFIQSHSPHYGIFSLPAFLAFQGKYKLDIVGQVTVSLAGGRQYFLISKTATDLAGCKGKTMASDHTDDPRFIERIVADGAFKLADFTVLQTQRPLQTIKKVITDEAVCALVDEAQLAELPHIEGADGTHAVWKSSELPQMVVAAFPSASEAERKRFQEHLGDLCEDERQSICAEVGIVSLKAASPADYAAVMAAYGK